MVDAGTGSITAVALSPLPNLLKKMRAGAELVHHVKMTSLGAELVSSEASIRLSADRTQLSVTLSSAGDSPGDLQLVRVAARQLSSGELLALVVIRRGGGDAERGNFTRHFDAADRYRPMGADAFGEVLLEALGESNLIDGITLHPAQKPGIVPVIEEHLSHSLPGPRPGRRACRRSVDRYRSHGVSDEADYLRKRMLTEITAALHSQRPSVAGVHISLANLYAVRIGMGASLLEDQAS
jgi:hypothetical protein